MFIRYQPYPVYSTGDKVRRSYEAQSVAEANEVARDLAHEVERLSLICESMWAMMKKKHGFEDIDLMEKMMQIDMMDGKLDGKKDVKHPPVICQGCGRTMVNKHPKCLYCGKVMLPVPFK